MRAVEGNGDKRAQIVNLYLFSSEKILDFPNAGAIWRVRKWEAKFSCAGDSRIELANFAPRR
jgi:hypothetical protein